jgi:hypothetical protein
MDAPGVKVKKLALSSGTLAYMAQDLLNIITAK